MKYFVSVEHNVAPESGREPWTHHALIQSLMPRLDHLLSFTSSIECNYIRPIDMHEEVVLRSSRFRGMFMRVVMVVRMGFVVAGVVVIVVVRHYVIQMR